MYETKAVCVSYNFSLCQSLEGQALQMSAFFYHKYPFLHTFQERVQIGWKNKMNSLLQNPTIPYGHGINYILVFQEPNAIML
jgi:hypothetical protein